MSRHLVDTNLLLRLLTADNLIQAKDVAKLLDESPNKLILTELVFAELAWTMNTFYEFPKQEIVEKLSQVLSLKNLEYNKTLMVETINIYSSHNIDFIDAYHAALIKQNKLDGIYSYDKDFDKVADIKRLEP